MLTTSQTMAVAVALVVFLGLVIPGVTRYVLLGGSALLLLVSVVWGNGTAFLPDFLR